MNPLTHCLYYSTMKKIIRALPYPMPVSGPQWFVEFWHKFDLARRKRGTRK